MELNLRKIHKLLQVILVILFLFMITFLCANESYSFQEICLQLLICILIMAMLIRFFQKETRTEKGDFKRGVTIIESVSNCFKTVICNIVSNGEFLASCFFVYATFINHDEMTSIVSVRYAGIAVCVICALGHDYIGKLISSSRKLIVCTLISSFAYTMHFSQQYGYSIFNGLRISKESFTVIEKSIVAGVSYVGTFIVTAVIVSTILNTLVPFYQASFKKISHSEHVVSFAFIVFLSILIFINFNKTGAYYTEYHDVTFSADTGAFFKSNVWMELFHSENDYRQPMFAIFSMPFFSPLYLVVSVFPGLTRVYPLCVAILNLILVYSALYVLGSLVFERKTMRFLFVFCYYSTFSAQLFLVVVEQYQVAMFYLLTAFSMFVSRHKNGHDRNIIAVGCAGTLSTSAVVALLTSDWEKGEKTSKRILQVLGSIILICLWLIAMDRFDVVYNYIHGVSTRWQTSNPGITLKDIGAFTVFIRSCFLQPAYEAGYIGGIWRVFETPSYTLSIFGLVVAILSVLSFIINRRKRIAVIAVCWEAYSFFMIAVMKYNGWSDTVLYSMYFGWEFYVLLFMLFSSIYHYLKTCRKVIVGIIVSATCLLFSVNALSIWEMSKQYSQYYLPNSFPAKLDDIESQVVYMDDEKIELIKKEISESGVPLKIGIDWPSLCFSHADVQCSEDDILKVNCRGTLNRNNEGIRQLSYDVYHIDFIGIKFQIDNPSAFSWLSFDGLKVQDQGHPSVFVYNNKGEILKYSCVEYNELDTEWHNFTIDIRGCDEPVTIIINGGYTDDTGSMESEYLVKNIMLY